MKGPEYPVGLSPSWRKPGVDPVCGIDTTTHSGKLIFHIMGALAEFERDLIRERTRAGMKAARKRGKHVGRPKALSPAQAGRNAK